MKNLKLKAARAARDWSQQQLADARRCVAQTIVAHRKGGLQPHDPPVHLHLSGTGLHA